MLLSVITGKIPQTLTEGGASTEQKIRDSSHLTERNASDECSSAFLGLVNRVAHTVTADPRASLLMFHCGNQTATFTELTPPSHEHTRLKPASHQHRKNTERTEVWIQPDASATHR
ncbi:hypothetical protein ROHU_016158 [Labeo rohita]|uniref:Uncharacterized protein n=1 Tax=Labeo rohita TaxID=84645 RepID=A0A498NL50_LABRO|nr:hypothetical protein ROHU_016158 [Labeo rohita]